MEVSNNDSANLKRRRTSSQKSNASSILSLHTLPNDHTKTISSYLVPTSQELLACALTAPSTSFVSTDWNRNRNMTMASKTIVNYPIEVLDFEDIGDLAGRLSDDDIVALLVCIDAKNNLKQLQLTASCKKLIGYGLAVLEHISLELPMKCLSFVVFTSILDSIITDGNSLREIKVSNIKHAKSKPSVRRFLAKFHKLLLIGDRCECEQCVNEDDDFEAKTADMICFECFWCTCEDCNDAPGRIKECDNCGLTLCDDHGGSTCYSCSDFHCSACADIDIVGAQHCDKCVSFYSLCTSCTMRTSGDCTTCLGLHFPTIVARNKKQEEENDKLKRKNKQLRSKNGDLTKEVKELQSEIGDLRGSGLGILA